MARAALLIVLVSAWPTLDAFAQQCPAGADVDIEVDDSASYCELCGVGQMTVRVGYARNNNPDITNIVISEDLSGPGLVPVPGTTTVDVGSGPTPAAPVPTQAGGVWSWDFGNFQLAPEGPNPQNGQFLEITFQVRRANSLTEEGLWSASKAITSSVAYRTATDVCPTENAFDTLAFRAPNPSIVKQGRNVDANQSAGQYANTVHGHNNDDVIWRIQIQNTNGLAALQDVRFDDLMAAGNVDINYACPTEADATTIANNNGGGAIPANCVAASNTINDFFVNDPFGANVADTNFPNGGSGNGFTRNLNGRDIDVTVGGTASVYLVGKLTANASCVSGGRTNTVSNFEFGCEADGGAVGGIADTGATATLSTFHGDGQAQLSVTRTFTGVNTVGSTTVSTQPLGARGLITLTISNQTGGTIKDIFLDDVLPPDYVIDPTYWAGGLTKSLPVLATPVVGQSSIRPAFNAYPGMIDRLTWENPQGSLTSPSQNPLQNTAPRFRLWSSTQHSVYPDQIHMLRHGDVVTVTFPIVLVTDNRATFEPYDLVADLDVTPEVTADGTDPVRPPLQTNQLTAEYNTFCPTQGNDGAGHFQFSYPNININSFPEDLDVAITDINNLSSSVFILTNDPNQELPIRVRVTNNGGHSAANYHAFVSFGATMQVVNAPAGCSVIALSGSPPQPNPWKAWVKPSAIPATATVYQCTAPASIAPAQTVNLDFRVIKTNVASRIAEDDLSLRADVVGEIILHDGTPLWFPTPVARPDGQLDRTNDYTLDGVRQRVIGFNLIKTTLSCNENDPPAFEPGPNVKQAQRVEIGEECTYRVRSGGWFGFETPGFTLIEVNNVAVTDNLPTGQGYVSSTDPKPTSSPQIVGIELMDTPVPPTPNGLFAPGTPFTWTFNQTSAIDLLDEWFEAQTTTRVLNNPINVVGAPNQHAVNSTNVLTSTFTAIYATGGVETPYALGPSTVGYPNEPIRREDLKITEPRITVVKEVCNETRYGVGPGCSNWTTLAADGDAFNKYIYRLRVTNEAAAGGIARSPAYDLVVTDTLDASGLACVMPFDTDGLDNDVDTQSDAGDTNGEGSVASNCTPGVAGVVTFSHTHSTGLRRLNPGQSFTLYYRVDFDDDAAPLQTFTNSYVVSYDSLAGSTNQSGNQTVDLRPNGDIGGARVYTSAPATARVRMIPVETQPKKITRTSNTPAATPPAIQDVVVGEEVEFELTTLLPVALLRNFIIRDELPPGLRCAQAPAVNLSAPPYAAAGFQPGGTFTPTCTDNLVEWNFGNQRITQGTTPDNRFPFSIRFITRVENSALTNNGTVISNGAPATNVTARYINEANALVEHTFGQVSMTVREPHIVLTKSFAPVVNADAADELTVTVTATNNGTSPAYNPRVFDDLTSGAFTYVGNIGGANPPTANTALLGANRPVFSYPAGYAIAPGASASFTFVVRVAATPQPHKVLANSIYAAWTSLPGRSTALNTTGQIGADGSVTGMRNGALPNAGDAINDYETQASASVTVPGLALTKADRDPALPPRIGTHKPFQIVVTLPEGETQNLVVADNLSFGAVSYVLANNASFDVTYEFVGIQSINGQAPGEAAFTAVPADGTTGIATWNIGRVVTTSENDRATNAITPSIRINYFARINNDLVTDAGDVLRNSVDTTYRNGETGAPQTLTYTADPITAIEPVVTATKELSNVTPGKQPTDPLALNDLVQYVVTIVNSGSSTAFDVNVVDTLPLELMLNTNYTPTATINGTPVAGFVGMPAGAPDGPLVWGRAHNDGSLDLPPGGFIELRYQVVVRAAPDTSTGLSNRIYTDWTSLDGASTFERTGAGCPTITAPNDYCFGPAVAVGTGVPAPPPSALIKANTQATAAVGEVFRYRVTVPSVAYPFALYDVRIADDLAASAADMRFIGATKISGSGAFTPVNTGSATNVVIEDTTNGIDIPANEQVVIEIAVQLTDTAANVTGLQFTNTATYYFNRINNNLASQRPGQPGTTQPMTIVGPDTLTMDKSGPLQLSLGQPGTFVLDVRNTGTGPAWDVTISDQLPNTPTSGMCEQAPSGFTAQLYQADGTTTVGPALVAGTDFTTTFSPAPACLLHIKMVKPLAVIPPNHHLIVRYQAYLDADSERNAALTNVAGATEWFSADRSNPTYADEVRAFTRTLTDGTPTVVDHEDAHTVTVDLPVLRFEKTVTNMTSGQSPATQATPGDTLRYRIRIENLVDDPLSNFTLRDELGRLNTAAVYASGTLNLVTVPAGADPSNTNPAGGVNNAGLVDIRNLSLGGLNSFIVVEYDVRLAPVLPNDSYVQNQAQAYIGGVEIGRSDDPNVNAAPDPLVLGDEDPTRVQIDSAPRFRVLKTSTYLGASTTVLRAGDRMRYTITVKNIGTDNATGVSIRDQVPTNTTYVASSTTLNGTQLNDNAQGITPLVDGIQVYAPENATPGAMRADATNTPSNVATITFEVTVYPDLLDGTVISNQAFVSALDFGIVDYPSDDPRTPIVNDPTRDVVGNVPLLFATKQAELLIDQSSPGVVDPGDTLKYTITIYNTGAIPATNVVLADNVPPNTTYVANSTQLNGLPYGQPDNGSSPLAAGIYVSSTDRTPPLPTAGEGTLSPNSNAVVTFNLRVNDGVPSGTIIRNQATVRTTELPGLLTDGDGNPSTGPEPTVVVVGNGQQLQIVKEVAVVGGGPAAQGATLEYTVRVTNISLVPALYVVITDDLNMPVPGYLTLVANSATLNGVATGITVNNQLITADYSTNYGSLQPQQVATLRFRAVINPDLLDGTKITNTGTVTWNNPPQTASASITIDVGGIPGVGILNGKAWHDANFNRTLEANERVLEGWNVELYRNDRLLRAVQTDANGVYRISGIPPNYITGERYELRFSAPDATASTAKLGMAYSPTFTNGLQKISDVIVQFASNLQDLNLPISPNGVAYNSVSRAPIAGVTLRMLSAGTRSLLPTACFDDPAQQNQVTLASGYYRFDLNFTDPACPSGGSYLIDVSPPPTGYIGTYSQIIPPSSGASTAAFSVPACPGGVDDALAATPNYCEVQISEFAPTLAVRARSAGTRYHAHLKLDNNLMPGTSQIYNNHIPLDPDLQGVLQISKTTPLLNVVRGQLVPYVITYKNVTDVPLFDVSIVDRIPAGFRYVEGSARIDRVPAQPAVAGRELIWSDLAVGRQESHEMLVLLAVGAGVSEGEFVNRVQAVHMLTGTALSNEASATVRVVPDPTFDCTDVTGKVFDDGNRNGHQDQGEMGLPGVRLVSARGLNAITDAYGRFHITCAVVPREGRGSNFVLKLDDRTLPSGYRSSTNQVRVERATRGKALRFNFGASLHRVIGLDLADAVFEPGTSEIRAQWRPRMELLMKELQKAPAILRLSYLADVENEQLVQRRMEAVKAEITTRWQSLNAGYQLAIEPEVFWRLGAPPQQAVVTKPEQQDESR
jgi:uncharacterized repeat protein (TIGR01451 family)